MNDELFHACSVINTFLVTGHEAEARNELIRTLDQCKRNGIEFPPLLNHLIRQTGLYPYLQLSSANWEERYVYEAFKVDVGESNPVTLHREQSALLSSLINGESLAVSAPTSFGKSFVIDSFIAITKPKNVVIIVPTIALTDETRRRLQRKFGRDYKIITTADVELSERNILIFPQERAIGYAARLPKVDILIIDEFYKASKKFDKDRSPSLLRAILSLSERAKQRYFLAPNISALNESPFTRGMRFEKFDFNTVFLEKKEYFHQIGSDEVKKSKYLLRIIGANDHKTLIYAGNYSNIKKVGTLLADSLEPARSKLLSSFESWLAKNYDKNWQLTTLVKRAVGIHNGQLHRSLSQIQVRLFEESDGLMSMISTSSIVEGVNTCAENVVIWKNKNGRSNLNDFTYKNIIGRGGRMFKHFIGKIYILENPPMDEQAELDLQVPDELLGGFDEEKYRDDLTAEQIGKIIEYRREMEALLGNAEYAALQDDGAFQSSDGSLLKKIAIDVKNDYRWNGLGYLNSPNPDDWDRLLYKVIALVPGGWDIEHKKFVAFVKILSNNWKSSIPQLLAMLDGIDIGIEDFFKLERAVVFKLSALLSDINLIQKTVLKERRYDISSFVAKTSFAFLPPVVYQLEEYGLPRMISRQIQCAGLIDFEDQELSLHIAIERLNNIGLEIIMEEVSALDSFDRYLLTYFFDGIKVDR
ncbi:helicase [Massilia sp. YIM B02769]|uniref:DEAD/DEAH box helicase n=1 Tax=Massilia sp. YIM B02769 TaxID=3050129 RepID=UPI0025B71F89|nr:DEAD/DEAH box helicase [Massilia sp. YIM B02769]MDN4058354.1 helicase [Massilia sp. YIM B02769]